jgi:acetoin utilization deacetylase AcuC-like enzyme
MISVFFDDRQVAFSSASPSAEKPKFVIDSWKKYNIEITRFSPVLKEDFYLAHSKEYVDNIFNLLKPNGFGSIDDQLNNSLLYTTGSFYSAAKFALESSIAVSPTSGFHHAGFNIGGGFCTFNGLIVTAQKLKKDKLVQTVGILDCDYHYGNGTNDIINKLSLDWITHYSSGYEYCEYGKSLRGDAFISSLPNILNKFKKCDIILYQAGADQYINDPLGGLLTKTQMKMRDKIVFEFAKMNHIPIVWNLAGGYTDPFNEVLEIHDNTMSICSKVYN